MEEKDQKKKVKVILLVSGILLLVAIILYARHVNPVNKFSRELKEENYYEALEIYVEEIKGDDKKEGQTSKLFESKLDGVITEEEFINKLFIGDLDHIEYMISPYETLASSFVDATNWYQGNPMINNPAQESLNELENRFKYKDSLTISIEKYGVIISEDQKELIEIKDELIQNMHDLVGHIRLAYYPNPSDDRNYEINSTIELIKKLDSNINNFNLIYKEYL